MTSEGTASGGVLVASSLSKTFSTGRTGTGQRGGRQDPHLSLNPRLTFAELIAEPLIVHKLAATRAERATTRTWPQSLSKNDQKPHSTWRLRLTELTERGGQSPL